MAASLSKRSVRNLVLVALAAAGLRLIFAPSLGYDLPEYTVWQAYIANHGLAQA